MYGSSPIDPFRILGLEPGADWPAIRAAYRRLVRETHPDREGGDTDRFVAVRQAYEALEDPSQRLAWQFVAIQTPRYVPDPLVQPTGAAPPAFDLRVRPVARGPRTPRPVALDIQRPCVTCDAMGRFGPDPCPVCGGSGRVAEVVQARVTLPSRFRHGDVRRLTFHVEGGRVLQLTARLLLASSR